LRGNLKGENKMKKLWGFGAVAVLFAVGSLLGQLNQSGGASLQGAAVTQSGLWTIQPGNVANTTPWLTTLSQGGNAAQVTAAGALKMDGSAVTQPVSGTLSTVPKTTCGTTAYDSGMVTLPTTSTAVTSTATCVDAIVFVNTTGATQTVSVTDNQGTPASYLSSFSLPANSTFVYNLQYVKMASGIKWSATNATSVTAQVVGFQ
jgi:hypothetical protein